MPALSDTGQAKKPTLRAPKNSACFSFWETVIDPEGTSQMWDSVTPQYVWETPYGGNCPALLFRLLSGLPRHAVNCGGKSKVRMGSTTGALFTAGGSCSVQNRTHSFLQCQHLTLAISSGVKGGNCVFKHAVVVLCYS